MITNNIINIATSLTTTLQNSEGDSVPCVTGSVRRIMPASMRTSSADIPSDIANDSTNDSTSDIDFLFKNHQEIKNLPEKTRKPSTKKIDKPPNNICLSYNDFYKQDICLKKYKLPELKLLAKFHKLHISGTKPGLIGRILSHCCYNMINDYRSKK